MSENGETDPVRDIFDAACAALLAGRDKVTVLLPVQAPFAARLPDGPAGVVVGLEVTFLARELRAHISNSWDMGG